MLLYFEMPVEKLGSMLLQHELYELIDLHGHEGEVLENILN